MAVSAEGLCTWGFNNYGQLGHGDHSSLIQPKVVEALRGKEILMVSAGCGHAMVLTREGLYTWGNGGRGQLGHGNIDDLAVPKVVFALQGKQIVDISAGGFHSMALTNEGLFTWGCGTPLCLGHGDCKDQFEPKVVTSLLG
eukprot:RCo052472